MADDGDDCVELDEDEFEVMDQEAVSPFEALGETLVVLGAHPCIDGDARRWGRFFTGICDIKGHRLRAGPQSLDFNDVPTLNSVLLPRLEGRARRVVMDWSTLKFCATMQTKEPPSSLLLLIWRLLDAEGGIAFLDTGVGHFLMNTPDRPSLGDEMDPQRFRTCGVGSMRARPDPARYNQHNADVASALFEVSAFIAPADAGLPFMFGSHTASYVACTRKPLAALPHHMRDFLVECNPDLYTVSSVTSGESGVLPPILSSSDNVAVKK